MQSCVSLHSLTPRWEGAGDSAFGCNCVFHVCMEWLR